MEKEQVLEEIRKAASRNGGQAPGRERFERETGIKVKRLVGRFWRSWGDALTEAGFPPNTLTPAYELDHLCQKLAELTRSLGRYPALVDIRMKARDDDQFPSHTVFSRLGRTKSQRVTALRSFCAKTPEFAELLDLLETPVDPEIQDDPGISPEGYVYLLKSGKFYKIGRTASVERRSREITIQLPEGLTTVHIIRTDDPPGIENYWHKRFAERRRNGEWFELTAKEIAAFRRRKFM